MVGLVHGWVAAEPACVAERGTVPGGKVGAVTMELDRPDHGRDCELLAPIRDRYVIVNADDFGQSRGINQGIIQAHEQGIVTSASLMVRWAGAAEAAAYGRAHPNFSLGL